MSMKRINFTIVIPSLKSTSAGITVATIKVPVRKSDGVEVLTEQAHDLIERRAMQERICQLEREVRKLLAKHSKD